MTKPHFKARRGGWITSTSRYAGFRIKRIGFGKGNVVFPDETPVAFDALPKGWRKIVVVEPYWRGSYRHSSRDERVSLAEVLATVPEDWHEVVVAAHLKRVTYDAVKMARGMSYLRQLTEELEEVRLSYHWKGDAVSVEPRGRGC